MDSLQEIRRPIEAELTEYRNLFDSALCSSDAFLDKALGYIRSRRGKMMRPILLLLTAKELGAVSHTALNAAVTLELLHTASLVHDDIVDESAERRGQASANAVYGNQVAVLLGDYLLAQSLRFSALTGRVDIVEVVAQLGATLSAGEIFQLSNVSNKVISEEVYFAIIKRKTAALFAACTELAARSMGADDDFVQRARKLGEIIGICFQIRDDIFDYFSDAKVGKPTGNDMLEGKLTLPAIYALNNYATPETALLAIRVKNGTASADDIAALVQFTKDNGGIAYAGRVMQELKEEALALISGFKNAEVRRSLEMYLDFVIGRDI